MAPSTNSSKTVAGSPGWLHTIIASTPVGICITNREGMFEYVNPTYCRLYGYSEDELVGNHFTMVVPPDQREHLTELHDRFLQQTVELRGEWTIQRKTGEIVNIIADAAYIVSEEGEPKKVTFVIDISDRKQMEVELERTVHQLNQEIEERKQLERTKDEVEKMVRHDLRNPLNAMLIATQLLLSDDLGEKQRTLVNMIQESGQKLNYMISNSIDFIRMEEGAYSLTPKRLLMTHLVRTVMQETLPGREERKVDVRLLIDSRPMSGDDETWIEGERIHLENLFTNLLRNAIEASEAGSVVTWEVINRENQLEFRIHNDGVIPEEIRDTFFQRYSTSGKRNGTGLGTYIAALIARAHGGEIGFDTSPENGTTLCVMLPRVQNTTEPE